LRAGGGSHEVASEKSGDYSQKIVKRSAVSVYTASLAERSFRDFPTRIDLVMSLIPRRTVFSSTFAAALVALSTSAIPAAADVPAAPPAGDPLAYQAAMRGLLEKHCFACHGPDVQEMGLNFAKFGDTASILNARDTWRKVREALEAGDMPPQPKDSDFTADDRKRMLAWIYERVETIDRKNPMYEFAGPRLLRRLTRAEYNNTIRDLIGFPFDAAGAAGIRGEEVAEGFVNLAGSQVVDEILLDKYFKAADETLKALFEEANRKTNRQQIVFARPGDGVSAGDAARKVLEKFVRRAYRRPPEKSEIDPLIAIVERAVADGDDYDTAIRKALKPVLVSPSFLFRLEEAQTSSDSASKLAPVSDHELAVRLSYFLWSTMPDDKLFAAADAGTLREPAVLDAEVKRMLVDPKAAQFTEHFGMQWLHLNELRRALPSRNSFPAFTQSLKLAMENEMRSFLDNLRTEDRSILDLLDADYTFANEELAKHYGLSGIQGTKMQRVALKPSDHRGGLLGMGGVLAMTSHTDRTKPTARGKWVLEVVLGTPPSPPPANVSNFKPQPKDKPEPKTFRDKLAAHAADQTCAACHKKIDPLGFALENYDAIGTWRETVGGVAVDNKGQLTDGTKVAGVEDLKKVLHARQSQFVRNFSSQMLVYALGRNLEYRDELTLAELGETLEREKYVFSAVVRGIVGSRQFQAKPVAE
jgi:mono/diheme cytochrome c family protein